METKMEIESGSLALAMRLTHQSWMFRKLHYLDSLYAATVAYCYGRNTENRRRLLHWQLAELQHDIPWEMVERFPRLPWDYAEWSRMPQVTLDIMQRNLNKLSVLMFCLRNPNVNAAMVQSTYDTKTQTWTFPWEWCALLMNDNIRPKDILDYPTLLFLPRRSRIDRNHLFVNVNSSVNFGDGNSGGNNSNDAYIRHQFGGPFSFNRNVTEEDVFGTESPFRDWHWNYFALTKNLGGHFPLEVIARHLRTSSDLEIPWDYEYLWLNATEDDVLQYPEIPWEFSMTVRPSPPPRGSSSSVAEETTTTKRKRWNTLREFKEHVERAMVTGWGTSVSLSNLDFMEEAKEYSARCADLFVRFSGIHRELLATLFDYDNRWYSANIK